MMYVQLNELTERKTEKNTKVINLNRILVTSSFHTLQNRNEIEISAFIWYKL